MLKLMPEPKFTANVALTIPGKEEPAVVQITYKYMTRTQVFQYFESMKGKKDAEALKELITGWEGFDEKYTPANLELLLEHYPAAATELITAYTRNLMESRVKN